MALSSKRTQINLAELLSPYAPHGNLSMVSIEIRPGADFTRFLSHLIFLLLHSEQL